MAKNWMRIEDDEPHKIYVIANKQKHPELHSIISKLPFGAAASFFREAALFAIENNEFRERLHIPLRTLKKTKSKPIDEPINEESKSKPELTKVAKMQSNRAIPIQSNPDSEVKSESESLQNESFVANDTQMEMIKRLERLQRF